MDKIIIDNTFKLSTLNINKDSYIVIDGVQANDLEINILDCKATILDMSGVSKRRINFKNCEANVVEILSDSKLLDLTNENSSIEYNVIDLFDSNVDYVVNEKIDSEGASAIINIASVCYKDKNKNYKINTANLRQNTKNEISCFGIVKDKSILNYDVKSFIEKGAKKSVVRQNSNILLFDEESIGKNNPILLIEENDVKASHGSSIGKIDDDTLFYMCSRGLSKSEATNLICLGKVEYLINKIQDEDVKESLINKFKERMS